MAIATPPGPSVAQTDQVVVPPPGGPLTPSGARFVTVGVQPPSGVYIASEDVFVLDATSSVAGLDVVYSGRMLRPDGQVIPFRHDLLPAGTRTRLTAFRGSGEGFLLSTICFLSSGAARVGQTLARILISRGSVSGVSEVMTSLYQDYVATDYFPAWPPVKLVKTTEGPGIIRSFAGTTPAAGAEVSQTVPTGARWILRGFAVPLVTAIAAANRAVTLVIDDGANILAQYQAQTTQIASLTRTYYAESSGGARDLTAPAIPLFVSVQIPLLQGFRIRTLTTNLQAADAYGAPFFWVEEYLEA